MRVFGLKNAAFPLKNKSTSSPCFRCMRRAAISVRPNLQPFSIVAYTFEKKRRIAEIVSAFLFCCMFRTGAGRFRRRSCSASCGPWARTLPRMRWGFKIWKIRQNPSWRRPNPPLALQNFASPPESGNWILDITWRNDVKMDGLKYYTLMCAYI